MARSLWRAALLGLLVAAVGLAFFAWRTRPQLDESRDVTQQRWETLRGPLGDRYDLLAAANAAVRTASSKPRDVVADVDAGLGVWRELRSEGGSLDAEVAAANELEGLGRRLAATVEGSPVLAADPAVAAALAAFADAPLPEGRTAYADAVHDYEDERGGVITRYVAGALGFDEVPALDLPLPA